MRVENVRQLMEAIERHESIHYMPTHENETLTVSTAIRDANGYEELEAMHAVQTGNAGFPTHAWLQGLRGVLFSRGSQTLAEIDVMDLQEFLAALMRNDAPKPQRAGNKAGNEKNTPPDDVTECARYIRHHWDLVSQGKAPAKTKKALILEAVGVAKLAAMDRALRPSRFGWLLTLPDK